ncbi:hypothetical protein ATY81_01765 [Rhizobium sp. R72]|nr:hypothetical protein ATY81_01765 [Rhizobium sp. R72]OWW05787.1 hypothetical protein ATY80_01765 [Rhizobium sp. R711]
MSIKKSRDHGRRRKTMISDHLAGLVDDENGREALLLIGERASPPMIEHGFVAGKIANVMRAGERFGSR